MGTDDPTAIRPLSLDAAGRKPPDAAPTDAGAWVRKLGPATIDWAQWMRELGSRIRHVREFVGLSQEQLARLAGVSQGAVSRLEAGRGLATPLLVLMKINVPLVSALRRLDPSILNDELRRMLEWTRNVTPPIGDMGYEVLRTTVPRLEVYAQSFGLPIPETGRGVWRDVSADLIERRVPLRKVQ